MVYQWLNRLSFAVLPSVCLLCGDRGLPELDLCRPCSRQLPELNDACLSCGGVLATDHDSNRLCGRCLNKPPVYDQLLCAYRYETPLDWMVQQMKFHAKLSQLRVLSGLFTNFILQQLVEPPELIIPVPLHKTRMLQRGFNQALELSKPLARHLNIPISTSHCLRCKDTPPQHLLSAKQRIVNMRNAFSLTKPLKIKSVAIVDDVVTTAATVSGLARLLKNSGVKHIQVWALARATIRP